METLKEWRKAAGLTQEGLAEKLHVDGQFISNIERGKAGIPPDRFTRLSKILNIPMGKLIRVHLKREEKLLKEKLGYDNPASLVRN